LHKPSVDVLRAVAGGLNLSIETLVDQIGLFEDPEPGRDQDEARRPDTEAAILADPKLSGAQRQALLAVYRSYVSQNEA
jgi:hypothetical protein